MMYFFDCMFMETNEKCTMYQLPPPSPPLHSRDVFRDELLENTLEILSQVHA